MTTPGGRLLGAVDPAAIDHVHQIEEDAMRLVDDIAEHFGDRQPPPAELRAYLRDRLMEHGRTPEEAEDVLADMDVTA